MSNGPHCYGREADLACNKATLFKGVHSRVGFCQVARRRGGISASCNRSKLDAVLLFDLGVEVDLEVVTYNKPSKPLERMVALSALTQTPSPLPLAVTD